MLPSQGLARLLDLLSEWFNLTLGDKLLEHLRMWLDPETLVKVRILAVQGWGLDLAVHACCVFLFWRQPPMVYSFCSCPQVRFDLLWAPPLARPEKTQRHTPARLPFAPHRTPRSSSPRGAPGRRPTSPPSSWTSSTSCLPRRASSWSRGRARRSGRVRAGPAGVLGSSSEGLTVDGSLLLRPLPVRGSHPCSRMKEEPWWLGLGFRVLGLPLNPKTLNP